MAAFNKFNAFVAELGLAEINLNTDTLKIMLSNTAPVATNTLLTDITEIAAGNGYTAGGTAVGSTAYSQASGLASLTGNAVTFTASGGSIGPFRYFVIYDSTASVSGSHPLIGWWDYGSSISLNSGEAITVGSDSSGSNWTTGAPILTLQ
jgi:hypothetical protein